MKRFAVGAVIACGLMLALLAWFRPLARGPVHPARSGILPAASVPNRAPAVSPVTAQRRASGNPLTAASPQTALGTLQLAAFTNFSQWAEQFLAGAASASIAEGQAMAWKRREAMRGLIETDPARALARAVPFHWRTTLPSSVTRFFESQVDGRGALNVAVATDFTQGKSTVYREALIGGQRYEAFVYGRRLRQVSQQEIPIHGIALDGKLAVQAEPLRLLGVEEAAARESQPGGYSGAAVCSVCGQSLVDGQAVAADIGGEVAHFCGLAHAELANARWVAAEGGSANPMPLFATASNDNWTHGNKAVLYMRVNFPDDLTEPISEAGAYEVMDQVNAFYTTGSYDMTSLSATVTPLVTVPQTKGWYSTAGPGALLDDAREAARRAGFDTANYDLDIACHTSVPGFDWGGLGMVHGKGVWLQSSGVGVTAHELGHNYGLLHAHYWDASTNNSMIGPGTSVEYGNIFDTMGAASAGRNQFNACFKNILDWLTDTTVLNVTSNGVYRLYPFDVPMRENGRFYAASIKKDYQRNYWVELHQMFTDNPWLENGVLLQWAAWPNGNDGSELIDTTPGSLTGHNDTREDAALVVGRTFSDRPAGVHITPLGRGPNGGEPWMDVQINLGDFPDNQPPVLNLEVEATNTAPGALVHFHAAASDPDGDTLAYAWYFDDSTFSTNNLDWEYKSWSTPGDHVVRCVVSDMKGGVASANALVTVGSPVGYRISGRVTDLAGLPLEGVRVDNGATSLAEYLGAYTDSNGRYLIVGVPEDLTLNATAYGFTFTNGTWLNPLFVTSNLLNIDFTALPLPTVRIAASTNTVPENSTNTCYFTLTRSGDLANGLTVNLYLSGSATLGGDYTLSPALANGTNTLDFPPRADTVVIAARTINDTTVEGPETVTLTLSEDPSYVLAPLAEATLTILDDDLPARPAVSVVATTPSIMENGMDGGSYVFSRTGGTQSDLPVYYTVGGTATPGVDYTTLLGVVVIPAGRSSTTIQFQPLDDKLVESNETVSVTLNQNAAYIVTGAPAQVTIIDDDFMTATIFPTDDGAAEPAVPGRFTVKRDGDLSDSLVVGYTVSGTATSGLDYQPLGGLVTIPAGAASADIVLTPRDDSLVEGDESVIVTLTNSLSYDVGTPGSATLFIRDNEKATVSITATDDTAAEPGSDTGLLNISRGSVVNGALTVSFAISGTAINGVDYVPLDNTAVIPDGASSVMLEVIPFDDLHLEPAEDVILTLLPGTNYNVGASSQARVTILDDDPYSVPAVGFTFSSSSAEESQSPGVSVSLSYTSTVPISVDYSVIGGTASTNDYVLAPGPLIFNPGEWAKSIPLQVKDNTIPQPNRTIRLVLFNPSNATLDGIKIHTYTIIDDDLASVSVTATAARASEANQIPGNFRIARTGSTNADLLVNFQITGTASAPTDYAALGTSVSIPGGATFVDLPVVPVDDPTVELDQTVVLTLISAPGGKIVSPHVATVTLSDNDVSTQPVVSVVSTNHPDAVEGGANGEFTFFRSAANGPLTVFFSLAGTAGNGVDYLPLTNFVTFADGQSSIALPVVAIDEKVIEGEETVVLTLTALDTYLVAYPSAATVTIQDSNQRVRVDASDFIASEPGADTGEFTFTRFGTTNSPLQVFYTISGTASNGLDYVPISNSIIIPAGYLSAALPIVPLDDALVEGPETVVLTLRSDPAYSLGAPTDATVTINDDEPMLTLTATVPEVVEGSQQPGVFTLTRTGDPKYSFTAYLAVGGTATYGVDYPPFLTNVYFSCGITAIDLLIFPTNELVVEDTETATATLLPDPAYTILAPSNAVISIADAGTNVAPVVTITSPTASTVFLLGTNVNLILEAAVTDDDTNTVPSVSWSQISGPDALVFGDTNQPNTTVSFTNAGVYMLRLTADDGQLQSYAEVTAVVDAVELLATNLLHWSFDEGSGTNALDSSGGGHNGVLVGDAAWVTNGALGGALRFFGTNDCVRLASGSNLLNGLEAFSISLWVNSAATNTDQGVLCADDSGTNTTLALLSKTYASCSHSTNVFEATFSTTAGVVRYVTDGDRLTNGWQHLALAWSNGLAPALFINGQLDQPLAHPVALAGTLTNCPGFIVGKGSLDSSNSWNGWIDDVRIFPRALTAGEIAALASLPPTNYEPVVDAGPDTTLQLGTTVPLAGVVTDDGQPNPPGAVSIIWSQIDGPVPVTLTNASSLTNWVLFIQSGQYVFRLMADDGQAKVFDDVTVTVVEPTRVDLWAADPEAAELGPDTGQFTFIRNGDTSFDLTVFLTLSGTASNGVDYVLLTNTVTFPAGSDTVPVEVTPYLDHRTEGDETVTLTIVSNLAYSIGSGEATVTIHDSPYGMWTISHFTIEELTDPSLSSEGADFDHDGLVNMAEYAANCDPKQAETNAPLVMSIELDPTDQQQYVMLTYPRRIDPKDVGYEVAVSSDLKVWHTGTNYVEEVQATPDPSYVTETVKVRVVEPYLEFHQPVLHRTRLATRHPALD